MKKERIKLILLVFLIATSILQVGILWSKQNHGLPTHFLQAFLWWKDARTHNVDVDEMKREYFYPYSIIASEGPSQNHWVLSPNSDYYKELWEEAQSYLSTILWSKNIQYRTEEAASEDRWSELVKKRGFLYEFKVSFDRQLLSWLLDTGNVSENDSWTMNKMLVLPWEDVNNSCIIYIYNGKKLFKYAITIDAKSMARNEYDGILSKLAQQKDLVKYNITTEFLSAAAKGKFSARKDMMIVVSEPTKGISFNNLLSSHHPTLAWAKEGDMEEHEILRIKENILGQEKDIYDEQVGQDSEEPSIVFLNQNSMYKIHTTGLLEYMYFDTLAPLRKGAIEDAFSQVVKFLGSKKHLITGADIYLTSLDDKDADDYYTFTFDYIISLPGKKQLPVYLYSKEQGISHAITIKANSKRVIECKWFIRKFSYSKNSAPYRIAFTDLLDNAGMQYKEIVQKIDNNTLYIHDGDIGFYIPSVQPEDVLEVEPSWIVRTGTEDIYNVKMTKIEGE